MQKSILAIIFFSITLLVGAQNIENKLNHLQDSMQVLNQKQIDLKAEIDELKLEKIREEIISIGLPELKEGEEVISHAALSLVYDENHEQAKWVSHIITSDIINGKTGRSNDFREDALVKTGSATEKDYFLKTLKDGSKDKYDYDGFGYDRGHLAPSADFRWSKKALSESYFYSNMSPQLPEFNREKWADLEGLLRGYIFEHPKTQLYVITGPI
jgi:endonuclease G